MVEKRCWKIRCGGDVDVDVKVRLRVGARIEREGAQAMALWKGRRER